MPILWFDDPIARERQLTGGKGASLAQMREWNLPVPPGFVVSAPSLAEVLSASGAIDQIERFVRAGLNGAGAGALAEDLQGQVLASRFPAMLTEAIASAYDALGGTVAVRSSAIGEDSTEASFAGQQDTFLDVVGLVDIVQRVHNCLASLFTERALVYRARRGAWNDLSLAVVVQRMVDPSAAGVMFTRDPVQGADRVVIEAVRGNGEALVSGEAVPDHYELDRGSRALVSSFLPKRSTGRVLADDQLSELFNLGLRVESLSGAPRDIEWAIDRLDGALALLQSRPITTL